jgi:hypothetical protein
MRHRSRGTGHGTSEAVTRSRAHISKSGNFEASSKSRTVRWAFCTPSHAEATDGHSAHVRVLDMLSSHPAGAHVHENDPQVFIRTVSGGLTEHLPFQDQPACFPDFLALWAALDSPTSR